jgi:WD40 repeat protein
VLRLETLRRLGGAEAIVRDHLQGALASLDGEEQDVAASMFEHLVTPSGTKIAHRAPDLADYANVPEDVLRRVLAELTRQRIVHSVDGSDRFEIFHDVLAEPIRDWRHDRRLERARIDARRRQRRLYVFSAASLVALAIVAGLAVWAFSERSSAQSQARHARARELEATALQQLPIDPDRSVRLALKAAQREPGDAAETVLRQALIADRLQFVRHTNAVVSAVATSLDGGLVAAAAGKSVLLSDARTGRLVRKLVSERPLAALSFAAGGQTLIGASPQGIAEAWGVPGGRPALVGGLLAARAPDGFLILVPRRGRLAQILPRVQHLSAAPDGGVLAAVVTDPDGHVHTWLFDHSGRRLHVLPQKGIKDIAFSPDGRLIATGGYGLTILWNARTGKKVRELVDSKNGVESVAFSPDGALLATGGHDSGVRIFTVATGERTYFLFGQTNPVNKVAWSPDGRVLVSSSFDRTIDLWRVQNIVGAGSLAATMVGNREGVDALAFTPDSTRVVSGGVDGSIRVWDAEPDQQLVLLGRAAGAAAEARWAGDTIAAAWTSGVVKVYDARSRRLIRTFPSKDRLAYTSLALSRDGSVIAAGSADGRTSVWNRDSGALGSQVFPSPVAAVAVSPRGDLVASGDVHGNIRVWDPSSGGLRWSAAQGGTLEAVAFSPGGGVLVTSGSKGSVLWSVSNGHKLHELASPKGDLKAAFSPNGRFVATAGSDSNGRLWFARSGGLYHVLRGHVQRLTDITFSRDGLHVATASGDSDVRIWSVSTGKGRPLQRAAFGPVPDVDFDSTGRWIVAAAPISAVVWRSASGRQLFYLRGQLPILTSASFAPRGPTILTSSSDGTVRTYTCTVCIDLPSLIKLAEEKVAATR